MNVEEAITSRRTIRCYNSERPERALIEKLIELAIHAPSASNKQPWRFFIVDNQTLIQRLAAAVRKRVAEISEHVEPAFLESFRSYGEYFVRFEDAPIVVVPLYREIEILSHLVAANIPIPWLDEIRNMEWSSGVVSTSLAIQNLLLAAHDAGLGTSCMTGPLVAGEELRTILGVPPSWKPACLIPIGYPDEEPRSPGRKPTENVVRWVEAVPA